MTDDELVARARQGDAAAFGELVSRHQAAVYRAALAAVGSASDADDVAQEAFLLAYTRLRSFRGAASFKTWLLTIAWNQAINQRRANTRWWRRIADVGPKGPMDAVDTVGPVGPVGSDRCGAETARLVSTSDTPEQLAAAGQLRRSIRQAIALLPRKLRDALLLAHSGEYSYQEIGAMLHAPVGTIKWRVSEARRMVKARLRARGYSDAG